MALEIRVVWGAAARRQCGNEEGSWLVMGLSEMPVNLVFLRFHYSVQVLRTTYWFRRSPHKDRPRPTAEPELRPVCSGPEVSRVFTLVKNQLMRAFVLPSTRPAGRRSQSKTGWFCVVAAAAAAVFSFC